MNTKISDKKGDITEIDCWNDSREFVALIFALTDHEVFLKEKLLRDLLRKSSMGVMAKIADGYHRGEVTAFHSCLDDSKGLLGTTISYLYVAFDQELLDREELNDTLAKGYTVGIRIKSFLKTL